MKYLLNASIFIAGCMLCVGCKSAATPEDLDKMCDNLLNVRGEGEVTPLEERVASIEKTHQERKKHLEDWKAREMKSWDDELAARIEQLKEKEDKKVKKAPKGEEGKDAEELTEESLKETYAKKKEVGAAQFDKDIAALDPKKDEELKAAKTKYDAEIQEREAKKQECLSQAETENVSQEQAQCRINAPDKDAYWNKCR